MQVQQGEVHLFFWYDNKLCQMCLWSEKLNLCTGCYMVHCGDEESSLHMKSDIEELACKDHKELSTEGNWIQSWHSHALRKPEGVGYARDSHDVWHRRFSLDRTKLLLDGDVCVGQELVVVNVLWMYVIFTGENEVLEMQHVLWEGNGSLRASGTFFPLSVSSSYESPSFLFWDIFYMSGVINSGNNIA